MKKEASACDTGYGCAYRVQIGSVRMPDRLTSPFGAEESQPALIE